MKPTLVEPQSPSGYGKVPFTTSGLPNLTNTGDNHKNNYKNIIVEISHKMSTRNAVQGYLFFQIKIFSLKSKMLQETFQSITTSFIPLRMLRRRRTTMTRRKRTRTEKERMGKTAKAGKTARAVKTRREKTAKETRRKRRRMRRKNRKFSLNEMVEENSVMSEPTCAFLLPRQCNAGFYQTQFHSPHIF